jgi:hypothetical protein
MQQKTFYIPGYNALVYCHLEKDGQLTLGGLNKFFVDTYTDNSRQLISKAEFLKLNPVEIITDQLGGYSFLQLSGPSDEYEVIDYKVKFYLEEAAALPAAPFIKTEIINSKISKPNKAGGQASLF